MHAYPRINIGKLDMLATATTFLGCGGFRTAIATATCSFGGFCGASFLVAANVIGPGHRIPLSLVSAFVADPLGSESTVERICEHVFEERSGLLYLLSAASWSWH